MTYYGSTELARAFRTVRDNTIVIAEEIPKDKYGFQATPQTRTVAQTLVHVAIMPRVQEQIHLVERRSTLEGFDFLGFVGKLIAEEQVTRSKAEILSMLRTNGEVFSKWLEGLTDDFLSQGVKYPEGMTPPSKTRFEMLMSAKEHEMHHRGQLMLVERMLGIVPHLTRRMEEHIAAARSRQATG